jgi:hypothetical protein
MERIPVRKIGDFVRIMKTPTTIEKGLDSRKGIIISVNSNGKDYLVDLIGFDNKTISIGEQYLSGISNVDDYLRKT